MLESSVENRLKRRIEARIPGAMCKKLVSPGSNGEPDRVIVLPYGLTVWVELKRPGQTPRPLQRHRHAKMKKLGHFVLVVDDMIKAEMATKWCEDLVRCVTMGDDIPEIPEELEAKGPDE